MKQKVRITCFYVVIVMDGRHNGKEKCLGRRQFEFSDFICYAVIILATMLVCWIVKLF
jgi:hypothetical protein